jgi:hypothetical protein
VKSDDAILADILRRFLVGRGGLYEYGGSLMVPEHWGGDLDLPLSDTEADAIRRVLDQ